MRIRHTSTSSPPNPAEDVLSRAQRREPGKSEGSTRAKFAAASAVARVDEAACIGCALCIEACPVDAIVGAARLMHTAIAAECIGCRLCLPPCPVNCIAMVESGEPLTREARGLRAARARMRYTNRVARREREHSERAAPRASAAERGKRAAVERAMQRAKERLARRRTKS